MIARVWRQAFQHHAVLLQHFPVQFFQTVAVHETPHIALPALHPANAPEEDAAVVVIFRHHHADDKEVAARPEALLVRNGEAHPAGAAVAQLHPVKIDAALPFLLENKTGFGRLEHHVGLAIPFRHRVRRGVQIGAVHRVHHVFQRVLVIAFPRGGAEEVAEAVRIGELVREGQLVRLLVRGDAKPEEDGAVRLLHVIAAYALLADQRTFIYGGHVFHFAVARHLYAVIPAGNAVPEVPAHRQARAAVRAAVLQRLHLAIFIAPDHNLLAQAGDAHRRRLHFPARQHRIPEATQAFIQIMLYGRRHRVALSSR